MSEVRLLIREAERDWSGTIHGSCANCAVAALSADPVTLDELEQAVRRFDPRGASGGRYFCNLRPGSCAEPYDAGLVVIDLAARLVVVDSTYSSPGPCGTIRLRDDDQTERSVSYHLADDWYFSADGYNWHGLAVQRRRERLNNPPLDARAVFYGRPMIEFIARETFAAFARREGIAAAAGAEATRRPPAKKHQVSPDEVDAALPADEEVTLQTWPGSERYAHPAYDTLKDIHAAWLLTPRDDLRGESPREVMFQRRDHISADLNDRCVQWTLTGQCPPGLDESSHAFRYAGFDTHEMVEYYELVRELLWSCLQRLEDLSQLPTLEDFLVDEVPRLERVRDEWLDTPDPEMHNRTPRAVIDRERARLPEGRSGHEAMIDHDCPLCRMMADESSGPMFWHLDGCNLDDDFAFDIYRRTREEWETEQREREAFSRKMDAEWAERRRLGVTGSDPGEDASNTVWKRSFSIGETAAVPLGIRVFGLGCRLAELIVELRHGEPLPSTVPRDDADRPSAPPEGRQWIDQLNRGFDNLREVLQSSDASLAESLIEPVIDRFVESLDSISEFRPDLAERCEALTEELHSLLDPPAAEPEWDAPGDDDVPF